MIQFKYYNEGATFDASSLNNDDIAFVEDENALYTHGKKFKFVDEVTPSPTPTPKAQLARFVLALYGVSDEVQVLTDTYGRILTQYTEDGDYRTACVYVPGDSRIDWDTAGDQELVTLLSKYGYNDALTIENNNVTISDNGDTETLTWDSAAMDFTVDVEMFQNGAQNMFFRTVNDGSQDVRVLCDADGQAIQADMVGEYTNVLFTVDYYGAKIDTITDDDTYSREGIINACGGAVNVTALDAGESVFLLVMGTHVQFCNADDMTTTPNVLEWVPALIMSIWANQECTENITSGYNGKIYFKIEKEIDHAIVWPAGASPSNNEAVIMPNESVSTISIRAGRCGHLFNEGGPIPEGVYESDTNLSNTSGVFTKFYVGGYYDGEIE